jgi:hypothetical protein
VQAALVSRPTAHAASPLAAHPARCADEYQEHKQILLASLSTLPQSPGEEQSTVDEEQSTVGEHTAVAAAAARQLWTTEDLDEVEVAKAFFNSIENARTHLNDEAPPISLRESSGEFAFGFDEEVEVPDTRPQQQRRQAQQTHLPSSVDTTSSLPPSPRAPPTAPISPRPVRSPDRTEVITSPPKAATPSSSRRRLN